MHAHGKAMKIPIFQVDAFTSRLFAGNPAAVCPLDDWLPVEVMQAVAAENNLSETAFTVPRNGGYAIRWFTPVCEVSLCGHATLAAAHVLFERLGHGGERLRFLSRSGPLEVFRQDGALVLDFPASPPEPCHAPPELLRAFAAEPLECRQAEDYLVVFEHEEEVADAGPDMALLERLGRRGVIITAPGARVHFVCRFFAPRLGVPEDPVTGSAFTQLAPYWSGRLGYQRLQALQLSSRGGEVECEVRGDRVMIYGQAVLYMQGEIDLGRVVA